MSQEPMSSDITSDDKLWAALAYVFSPLVPIILMLMEDKKNQDPKRSPRSLSLQKVLDLRGRSPLTALPAPWSFRAPLGYAVRPR